MKTKLLLLDLLVIFQVECQVSLMLAGGGVVEESVGDVQVIVTLSPTSFTVPQFVSIVTVESTASAAVGSQDFLPLNISLIFEPGTIQQTFNVTIVNDSKVEQLEFFNVEASIANENSVVSTLIVIQDDDILPIAFEQDEYTYSEGDRVADVCVVIMSGSTDRNLRFTVFTSLGNASDVVDYVPLTFDLSFSANGSSRVCAPVSLFNDTNVENTEFFFAHLTGNGDVRTDIRNVTIVFISDTNGAVLRVVNEEGNTTSIFSFGEEDANASVSLCVLLVSGGEADETNQISGLGREVSLLFTTTRDTAGPDDFISVTNSLLAFPSGTTNEEMSCVNVTIIGDIVFEATESFNFSFTTVNPLDSIENGGSGRVIIVNDDPVDCGSLPAPENGVIILNSTMLNGTATFSCNAGYELAGNQTRTCLASGNWSGSQPSCEAVDCGSLPAPENGVIDINITKFNSTASYSCDTGYELAGNQNRTCLASGNWSGSQPSCEAVDCGSLLAPENGVIFLNSTMFNNTATFSCYVGYELIGNQTRNCLASGNWSGSQPSCEAVDCGSLPAPENGVLDTNNITTFNSTASFSCSVGYELIRDETRTCLANGSWSGAQPSCDAVDCGSLPAPENGVIDINMTTFNNTASYSCDTGYELAGNQTRTCQASGNWSDYQPSCETVDCGSLPEPENGDITINATVFNSTITYSCDIGYELNGNHSRTCLASGNWSDSPPSCNAVDCGSLPAPENGVINVNMTTFNTTASYSCDTGYELAGNQTRTCLASGNWSGSQPSCEAADCGPLLAPENGMIDINATTLNSTAAYSCDVGYDLERSQSRSCLASGNWSGSQPSCYAVDCGSLPAPENGVIDINMTTFNNTASYSCDTGYELAGNQTRTCQASGNWSDTQPLCNAVDCGSLTAAENGAVNDIVTTFNSTATYSCDAGYELNGNESRVCQASGNWSGSPPSCNAVDCGALLSPENGVVTIDTTTFNSTASYSCLSGYKVDGSYTRTCLADGNWSERVPLCTAVDCGSLPAPENGVIDINMTTFNSTASYSCDTGYELAGNQTRTCLASGNWSGSQPSCEAIDCGPLSAPVNGAVNFTRTTFQSVTEYSCDPGFSLFGPTTRVCLASGEWSNNASICLSVTTVGSGPVLPLSQETVRLALVVALPVGFVLVIVIIVIVTVCCVNRHRNHVTYSLKKYTGNIASMGSTMVYIEPLEQPVPVIRRRVAAELPPTTRLSMINANMHAQDSESSSESDQSDTPPAPLSGGRVRMDATPTFRLSMIGGNLIAQHSSTSSEIDLSEAQLAPVSGQIEENKTPPMFRHSLVSANPMVQDVESSSVRSDQHSEIQSITFNEAS